MALAPNLWLASLLGYFDRLATYEASVMTVVSIGAAILFAPLYQSVPYQTLPHRPGVIWVIVLLCLVVSLLQLVTVVTWNETGLFTSGISLTASLFSLLGTFSVTVVFSSSHACTFPPPAFPSIFLAATIPYELAIAEYCLRSSNQILLVLQLVIIGIKCTVVSLGYLHRKLLRPERPTASDHQYFLPWSAFNPIAGLRSNFTIEDLPPIAWNKRPDILYQTFLAHFVEAADKTSNLALIEATLLTLQSELLGSALLHICHILFILSFPFFLRHVLQSTFLGEFSLSVLISHSAEAAFILTGIAGLKFASEASDARPSTAIRSIYITAVYSKMLRLSAEDVDTSLLGTDMPQILDELEELLRSARCCFWAGIRVCLGVALLLPFAGACSFFLLLPLVFVAVLSISIAAVEAEQCKVYNAKRHSHCQVISSVLTQIVSIKLMGLENVIVEYLCREKAAEITALLQEQCSRMAVFSLGAFNRGVTPVLVLLGLIYLNESGDWLLKPNAFACFAMMSIIIDSASHVIEQMANRASGLRSIKRLEEYLMRAEVPDWRQSQGQDDVELHPRVLPTSPFGIDIRALSVESIDGTRILQNLTMQLLKGRVAVVYGTEPCGKSTLARAILGEIPSSAGSITLSHDAISFCSRNTWITNQTIQENIVGNCVFHQTWYRRVIRACSIPTDLRRLPERDQTMAGSSGCNFDASFKQRIALARAVFERASLLILDGILSAVHPDTAQKILRDLFGPQGLIREWDCTVVMMTNNYEYLRYANVVFEMNQSYQFRRIDDVAEYLRSGAPASQRAHEPPIYRNADLSETIQSRSLQLQHSTFVEESEQLQEKDKLALFCYFSGPAGRFSVALVPFMAAATSTMLKAPEIFLRAFLLEDSLEIRSLLGYTAVAVSIIIAGQLSARMLFKRINTSCSEALHARLTDVMLSATHSFFRAADLTLLFQIFTEDMQIASRDLPVALIQLVFSCCTSLLNITVFSLTTKYAWFLILGYAFMLYHARMIYIPLSRKLRLLNNQAISAVAALAVETVEGIAYIRAMDSHDDCLERNYFALESMEKTFYHQRRTYCRLNLIIDLFTATSGTFLIILAHTFRSSSSVAALGLALATLVRFSDETTFLVNMMAKTHDYLGAVSRIRNFCESTPREDLPTSDSPVHPSWPAFGGIVFENVATERNDNEGDMLTAHNLEGISFSLPPMEKVGICARAGHGQSALILTLLGLEDYSGTISIDTLNTRSVPPRILRSRITTITQDGLELYGSVRLNLDPLSVFNPHFTDMDLLGVLERVGLWETVSRHGGLDVNITKMHFTPVQRQLLGLARATLHRRRTGTNIVLIDKATSNLEGAQELQMQDFMDGEFATCSVITIADRMTTVQTADHLCILEAGALQRVIQHLFLDVSEETVG